MTRLAAVAVAFLMLTVLTITRSEAAFSATTVNTSNSFATGSVVLTDDDTGSAMFSLTGMKPGTTYTNCITVTYSGTLTPATVKLYGSTTSTLDTYLDAVIDVGTGGSFGDCTGFSLTTNLYTGTLANFDATHTNFATGVTAFTAATNPTVRTVRFQIDVQDNNAAQSLSSTADFTFEAQA